MDAAAPIPKPALLLAVLCFFVARLTCLRCEYVSCSSTMITTRNAPDARENSASYTGTPGSALSKNGCQVPQTLPQTSRVAPAKLLVVLQRTMPHYQQCSRGTAAQVQHSH